MSAPIPTPANKGSVLPRRGRINFSRPFLLVLVGCWLCLTYLLRDTVGPELLLLGLMGLGILAILGGGRSGLLSPIFYYDLVRTARRGQLQAHRFLFAVCLAAALYLMYSSHVGSFDPYLSQTITVPRDKDKIADFTWSFVSKVLLVQYLAVLLVTPAYVATALPQEKQQRTLEFILTTDLSDREIVLGLLTSRLANLFLLIITGLPILGFLQFLGGVDPQLLLVSFAVIVLTMLSVGSVCVLVSVFAPTTVPALLHAYLWVLIFTLGGFCIPPLNFANPILSVELIEGALQAGHSLTFVCTGIFVVALLYHGAIAYSVCRWAIREFRAASLGQLPLAPEPAPAPVAASPSSLPRRPVLVRTNRGWQAVAAEPTSVPPADTEGWGPFSTVTDEEVSDAGRRPQIDWDDRPRRRVGEDALLWKETLSLITGEQIVAFFHRSRLVLAVAVFGAWFGFNLWIDWFRSSPLPATDIFNRTFRSLNVGVFSLVLFAAAVTAAGRVSREREQQTLEALRTLPVGPRDILFAKWFGSIWTLLPICGLLLCMWAIAALFTVLHAAALPLLFAASAIYLGFMASLGLWFSTVQRTTLRSTLFTVLVALLLLTSAGTVLVGRSSGFTAGNQVPWIERLYDHTVSPAQTLWTLAFSSPTLLSKDDNSALPDIIAAVIALHFYMLLTALLWISMTRRLQDDEVKR